MKKRATRGAENNLGLKRFLLSSFPPGRPEKDELPVFGGIDTYPGIAACKVLISKQRLARFLAAPHILGRRPAILEHHGLPDGLAFAAGLLRLCRG